MGIINPENFLKFRSSKELFSRIKNKLASFDSQNMIDEADFYDFVVEKLEELGAAVYKECESVTHVKDYKACLPCNFKEYYAAYKCHPEKGTVPSINQQNNFGQPWIYFQDKEFVNECGGGCNISCSEHEGKCRVIVRTFVNGDSNEFFFGRDPEPLTLSPNVHDRFHDHHHRRLIPSSRNEITIQDRTIRTHFTDNSIYLQYYGLPIDDEFLPMIPDETIIEKAIEYYIYKMLYEQWYMNGTVPNIIQQLQYVTGQYDFYMKQALYYCKLPSFKKMVQAVRVMRGNNKFYQFPGDRTIVGNWGYGGIGYGFGFGGRRW